ncbi:MAG: precorrin-2 C(20)-methyltransferase [Lachnospiraceae bacterium]|nr:precorrin-2 C(20)-methyltransferase [Lachnospiraceae bacterium]
MKGKLIGLGIGPGDPELLTLKALRIVKETEVIAVPGKVAENTVAYKIVSQAYPELKDKTLLPIEFLMTKDPVLLDESHNKGAKQIMEYLDRGQDVAFLTLGDSTLYATYMYVHHIVAAAGYTTEIVSGITSFCAVAARLNMSLVEQSEELHVIPASYQIFDALKLRGTKVLMKAASKMPEVKAALREIDADVVMIENCGMPDEKIFRGVEEIPDNAGYYSLIIVKEKKA